MLYLLPVRKKIRELHPNDSLSIEQVIELIQYTNSPSDSRCQGSTRQTQRRNWSPTTNEQRAKDDVCNICQHQALHSHICIARTAKYSIDEKQQHDHNASPCHDPRVSNPISDCLRSRAHHIEYLTRIHEACDTQYHCYDYRKCSCLRSGLRRP